MKEFLLRMVVICYTDKITVALQDNTWDKLKRWGSSSNTSKPRPRFKEMEHADATHSTNGNVFEVRAQIKYLRILERTQDTLKHRP